MIVSRRGLLTGFGAILAAPAIVRAESLMAVKPIPSTHPIFDTGPFDVEGPFILEYQWKPVGQTAWKTVRRVVDVPEGGDTLSFEIETGHHSEILVDYITLTKAGATT
jgi:hypothetical protein